MTKQITVRLPDSLVAELDSESGTRSDAIRRRIDEHRRIIDAHQEGIDVRPIVAMMAAESDRRREP